MALYLWQHVKIPIAPKTIFTNVQGKVFHVHFLKPINTLPIMPTTDSVVHMVVFTVLHIGSCQNVSSMQHLAGYTTPQNLHHKRTYGIYSTFEMELENVTKMIVQKSIQYKAKHYLGLVHTSAAFVQCFAWARPPIPLNGQLCLLKAQGKSPCSIFEIPARTGTASVGML